jgi:hypothetical protein
MKLIHDELDRLGHIDSLILNHVLRYSSRLLLEVKHVSIQLIVRVRRFISQIVCIVLNGVHDGRDLDVASMVPDHYEDYQLLLLGL